MLKDLLAIYGAMRLLNDAGRSSPPPDNNNDTTNTIIGCGCFLIILIIILGSCAGCMLCFPWNKDAAPNRAAWVLHFFWNDYRWYNFCWKVALFSRQPFNAAQRQQINFCNLMISHTFKHAKITSIIYQQKTIKPTQKVWVLLCGLKLFWTLFSRF